MKYYTITPPTRGRPGIVGQIEFEYSNDLWTLKIQLRQLTDSAIILSFHLQYKSAEDNQ
jgi:hypothetical protein